MEEDQIVIRPATTADLPAMVEMGQRFFDASGYSDITEYSGDSLALTLQSTQHGVFLIAEKNGQPVGMSGALLFPLYFNFGHITAQELFWWVDPEHRGIGTKLFDALEASTKALGAKSLSMIALEKIEPDRVGGFYEKRGYRPSERSFIKGFE